MGAYLATGSWPGGQALPKDANRGKDFSGNSTRISQDNSWAYQYKSSLQ